MLALGLLGLASVGWRCGFAAAGRGETQSQPRVQERTPLNLHHAPPFLGQPHRDWRILTFGTGSACETRLHFLVTLRESDGVVKTTVV
jgi:hypothetical protein